MQVMLAEIEKVRRKLSTGRDLRAVDTHNGDMSSDQGSLFFSPAQVAELLGITPEEVVSLVHEGRLRGTRLGTPAAWRIEKQSVRDYLDDENEAS